MFVLYNKLIFNPQGIQKPGVVSNYAEASEKGKMKVAKVQSGNSSFVVGYYGEWKPQSIYVPVCLWIFVPSKSNSIWN